MFVEQTYIDAVSRTNRIYNTCLTAGNCIGIRQSAETKEKRAAKLRGRKCSDETKRLISEKAKARGRPIAADIIIARAKAMTFKLSIEEAEAFVRRHATGESWAKIAASIPISVKPLRRALRAAGIDMTKLSRVANSNIRRGSQHGMARITDGDVLEIRSSSLSNAALAEMYGLSRCHVSDIRCGRVWQHTLPGGAK